MDRGKQLGAASSHQLGTEIIDHSISTRNSSSVVSYWELVQQRSLDVAVGGDGVNWATDPFSNVGGQYPLVSIPRLVIVAIELRLAHNRTKETHGEILRGRSLPSSIRPMHA